VFCPQNKNGAPRLLDAPVKKLAAGYFAFKAKIASLASFTTALSGSCNNG